MVNFGQKTAILSPWNFRQKKKIPPKWLKKLWNHFGFTKTNQIEFWNHFGFTKKDFFENTVGNYDIRSEISTSSS